MTAARRGALRLVLEDFPSPAVARALSPNGRVHWRRRHAAQRAVAEAVWVALQLPPCFYIAKPLARRARLRATFVYPERRKRDDDNLATGVLKAVRDALVRLGVLEADDMQHLQQEPVQVEVRKGERRLVVELEEVEALDV
jgi:Holliday junction resolvase RusA-like endonuclease